MKNDILKNIVQQKPRRVVFDLDSTLFCVSYRTQAILSHLAGQPKLIEQYPEAAAKLSEVQVSPLDWGIRSALIRHQITGPLNFFESLRQLWAENFFANDYLHFDRPYPGAVDFLQNLARQGVEIFYLTGRDRPRMGKGTEISLKAHQFPLHSSQHLVMKPESQRHDEDFKNQFFIDQELSGSDTWFFENEPVIINRVRRSHPGLNIVFVDTVHSQREPPPDDLPRLLAIDGEFLSY